VIIIPAVDITNGRCVRLLQGRKDKETVFSEDPVAMSRRWEQEGAERIHVVDLDGAFEKKPKNLEVIERMIQSATVPVQVGGGIRERRTVERYIQMGADRIIIGTEAVRNPSLIVECCKAYPDRIAVAIDARGGLVAIEGWVETTRTTAVELAKRFEATGVAAINFTDIHRDGMQTGPNIEETRKLTQAVSIPVIASGGVSSLEDIRSLLPLEAAGVVGVITGKALYTGSLRLADAIAVAANRAT
jgi:phosphoribosylformimino-5-aminoimidazole carboxamide ribotide isomerase